MGAINGILMGVYAVVIRSSIVSTFSIATYPVCVLIQ